MHDNPLNVYSDITPAMFTGAEDEYARCFGHNIELHSCFQFGWFALT